MYNMETKKMSVKELVENVKGGLIIREGLQRTPSHDEKKASEILQSIYEGRYCGAITLSKMEGNILSILDGSSRLQDFTNYVSGVQGYIKKSVYDTDKEKEVINKYRFNELTKQEQDAILNYTLPCIILEGVDNGITFVNLNSSTALSNIQKSKGNLKEEFLQVIDTITNSKIINNILSQRLLQRDEGVLITFQILSNIYGVYNASNKKLVEAVKNTDLINFDIDRFKGILSKFDNIEIDVNKYCFISLVSVLYNSPIELDKLPMFDNNVIFKIDTTGANSAPANDKRINKACKVLNNILGVSVKTGNKLTKSDNSEVEVEEVSIDTTTDLDLNELLK